MKYCLPWLRKKYVLTPNCYSNILGSTYYELNTPHHIYITNLMCTFIRT